MRQVRCGVQDSTVPKMRMVPNVWEEEGQVNIEDVKEVEQTEECRLEQIFQRQHELMEKYGPIEERNGVGRAVAQGADFDLDDPRWQYLLKDFAWRTTEEIGEALDAWSCREFDHAREEVADGLHFLVELLLITGMDPDDLCFESDDRDRLEDLWPENFFTQEICTAKFVEKLGMAMCCLKNRPWKQTQFSTDREEFKRRLIGAFRSYLSLAASFGLDSQSLYEMYFKKSRVNHFRIESKY